MPETSSAHRDVARNARFAGSIPELSDQHLGPLLFVPYAADIAGRLELAPDKDVRVLEVAAGTGRVSEHLLARVAGRGTVMITDLNEPMLLVAKERLGARPDAQFRQADVMALPFRDGEFDAVVCQFGVMFFPDKPAAMREMHRVLVPNGQLLFNVWASLDENPFGRLAHEVIGGFFPDNPPDFYQTPFGYHDFPTIRHALESAGFHDIEIITADREAAGPSAHDAAVGLVLGNPVVNAINERGTGSPETIVTALESALIVRYGAGPLRFPMRAHVVLARA